MLKIKEAIIVEGKYDKIKLSQIVDTVIIDVGGFNIFKDQEKLELIRTLAEKNGIIILTDSDNAGFLIRNYIKSTISNEKIRNIYIPDIIGKEKRKRNFSKERKLGVEGIPNQMLVEIIKNAVEIDKTAQKNSAKITKLDFFNDGLSGKNDSTKKRNQLKKLLNLPENLSQNALLKILNEIITYEDYLKIVKKLS